MRRMRMGMILSKRGTAWIEKRTKRDKKGGSKKDSKKRNRRKASHVHCLRNRLCRCHRNRKRHPCRTQVSQTPINPPGAITSPRRYLGLSHPGLPIPPSPPPPLPPLFPTPIPHLPTPCSSVYGPRGFSVDSFSSSASFISLSTFASTLPLSCGYSATIKTLMASPAPPSLQCHTFSLALCRTSPLATAFSDPNSARRSPRLSDLQACRY
mmetsp:Transcript_15619/g.27922  ORF Transcript_15619/g.27922 Transcript_15619/m.27922 type:complete len:210 (-) Transcript_15619:3847-4476(-)